MTKASVRRTDWNVRGTGSTDEMARRDRAGAKIVRWTSALPGQRDAEEG
jgi:hypothetical protein